MAVSGSDAACWNNQHVSLGQAERCSGSRAAGLREQQLLGSRAGVAGGGGEGSAERQHTVAADKVLFGTAGTRRGHRERGKSGNDRSGEFGVSRMAREGLRRESGPCLDVFRNWAGEKNA